MPLFLVLRKLGGCQLPAVQVQCILFANSRYNLRSHRTMKPENQETITRLPVITIRPPILRIERQKSITCVLAAAHEQAKAKFLKGNLSFHNAHELAAPPKYEV